MLKLLGEIPILGTYLVAPLLDGIHLAVNTVQFIVGI